jgi:UDP-N-acetylmuramate dehydrogenase
MPYIIIGGGSNLLLTRDFEGIVVRSAIKGYCFDNKGQMTCGSGETWDDMVAKSIEAGYYGMENLSLIPGEVGASAVQNIGAYGAEAKDIIYAIEAIEIATGEKMVIPASECQYAYRQSRFKNEWKGLFIITAVTYRLSKTFLPKLEYGGLKSHFPDITAVTATDVRNVIIKVREEKLPDWRVEGNGGSFFMNPVVNREKLEELLKEYPDMPHYDTKIPAAWMIEQCGWKGKTLGRAGVHDRQALVLVNKGGATGKEILKLCNAVIADVEKKFGITLHPEVNIV